MSFHAFAEKGLIPRVMVRLGTSERVRLEDSLKHLYKCEYAGRTCSVNSVAGSVGVSREMKYPATNPSGSAPDQVKEAELPLTIPAGPPVIVTAGGWLKVGRTLSGPL